jgi:hypothetical protein
MDPPASMAPVSAQAAHQHGAMGTAPILQLIPRTAVDVARRELPHLFLASLLFRVLCLFWSAFVRAEHFSGSRRLGSVQ